MKLKLKNHNKHLRPNNLNWYKDPREKECNLFTRSTLNPLRILEKEKRRN